MSLTDEIERGRVVGIARNPRTAETRINVERRGKPPCELLVFDLSGTTRPGDAIRWCAKFAFVSRPGEEHAFHIMPARTPEKESHAPR